MLREARLWAESQNVCRSLQAPPGLHHCCSAARRACPLNCVLGATQAWRRPGCYPAALWRHFWLLSALRILPERADSLRFESALHPRRRWCIQWAPYW